MKAALLCRLEAEARGPNGSRRAQFFLAWSKLNGVGVPKDINATELFRQMTKEWDPESVRYLECSILEGTIHGDFGNPPIFDVLSEIKALERELGLAVLDAEDNEILTSMSATRNSMEAVCHGKSSLEDHRELLRDLFRRYCHTKLKKWIPYRFRPPQFPQASIEAELISSILQKDFAGIELIEEVLANRQSELTKLSA
jgi:hypothetical protein